MSTTVLAPTPHSAEIACAGGDDFIVMNLERTLMLLERGVASKDPYTLARSLQSARHSLEVVDDLLGHLALDEEELAAVRTRRAALVARLASAATVRP
jgi:hypothetical protein